MGRRTQIPMTYLGKDEKKYGLIWQTEKFKDSVKKDINSNVKLYIRGRYIQSNCPVSYLDEERNCNLDPTSIKVSEWTTKTIWIYKDK